ncbi:uncharacterized protein LOC109852041 [Pseudomyrmex gracilis]|uniref:uncharacterized protein LOC109852041 n=1 Tax=Pseudomyrmex gracilis TaxID=219809 RepID=UPI00099551B8|nr:uncharacterized protein LOC109852041 [Pseudomyrmex gracilis]XP_020278406.1 uncharacterized protein LOC109852041 [Pseudomyrmex gracilis]
MCDIREILTMPPDSQRLMERIIEAIKQHPVLYCSEVTGFSGKINYLRQKVWERIANELGVEPTWLKLKWNNIKDTYSRIIKLTLSKTDEENATRRKWYFEDHLSFLKLPFEPDYVPFCLELSKEYIDEIYSNKTTPEGLLEQLEDPTEEEYKDYEVLEETPGEQEEETETIEVLDNSEDQLISQSTKTQHEQQMQQDADSYVPQKKSKYQKKKLPKMTSSIPYKKPKNSILKTGNDTSLTNNTNNTASIFMANQLLAKELKKEFKNNNKDIEMNLEQVYVTPENKSSIELFFESMAQTVKKLPPKAQADIKLNICKIVTEAEVEYVNSGQNAAKNTQHLVKSSSVLPKMVLIPCNMLDKKDSKKQQF